MSSKFYVMRMTLHHGNMVHSFSKLCHTSQQMIVNYLYQAHAVRALIRCFLMSNSSFSSKVAALFDHSGEVIWTVRDRATVTGLTIHNIDRELVNQLHSHYLGSKTLRFGSGSSIWTVYGRKSEVFANDIIEHTTIKKDLLIQYLNARREIDTGRGVTGILSESALYRRRVLEEHFRKVQEK